MSVIDIVEILPWIVTVFIAIHSIFKRSAEPFLMLPPIYFVLISLYFAYKSIFDYVRVDAFLHILPLHLALLFFISLIFCIKKVMTFKYMSELIEDKVSFLSMIVSMLIAGGSFFVGSAFMGYGSSQYFFSVIALMFVLGVILIRYEYPVWTIQVAATVMLFVAAAFYLHESITGVETIDAKQAIESVTKFNGPILVCVLFFLIVLSSLKLVTEKMWGHLLTIYVSLMTAGFLAHHPEVSELMKPVVKEILQVASVSGDAGVSLYSIAKIFKAKSGIA